MGPQVQLLIFFGGIDLLSMEDCAPSTFLQSWALVICVISFIYLIDPFWRSMLFKLGGGGTPPLVMLSCNPR